MKTLTATTQKGQKIKINPIVDAKVKNMKLTATHGDQTVSLADTSFMYNNGAYCLKLDARKIKTLLGISIPSGKTAGVKIDQDNYREIINEWKQTQKKQVDHAIQEELDSMNDDDMVSLIAFSGYGMHHDLQCEKLSMQAQTAAANHIKEIISNHETQEAPELNSRIAYKVEMTWGQYQQEVKAIENAEQQAKEAGQAEKQAKFNEAQKTGKPVKLWEQTVSEEDLPRAERESESSVAFVSVFAMPDGSTKRDISHAY